MTTQQAYNEWAAQYDTNNNKTRDLEAIALRNTLSAVNFKSCLEIGCGTGKNTVWFIEKADRVTAVDLSPEMLAKARSKITSDKVTFVQADITQPWLFTEQTYDLISFSLVLEHIEGLEPVFKQAVKALSPGGYVYVGELHPFKQYSGSKARFETADGVHIVSCFNHHTSDFVRAATQHGLKLAALDEYFDDENRAGLPRILMLLFEKQWRAAS